MISKFVNLILIFLYFTQAIKLLDAFCRVPNTSDGPHHAGIPLGTCRLGRGAVAVFPVVVFELQQSRRVAGRNAPVASMPLGLEPLSFSMPRF